MFALASPIFAIGIAFVGKEIIRKLLFYSLSVYAFFPVCFNFTRPLIRVGLGRTIDVTCWDSSRDCLMFSDQQFLYDDYEKMIKTVLPYSPKKIGIVSDWSTPEYIFWYSFRKYLDDMPIISSEKDTSDCDIVIIADVNEIEKMNEGKPEEEKKYYIALKKDKLNNTTWEQIYPVLE